MMLTEKEAFADLVAMKKILADAKGTDAAMVARLREAEKATHALRDEFKAIKNRGGEIQTELARHAHGGLALLDLLFDVHGEAHAAEIAKHIEASAASDPATQAPAEEPPPTPSRAERLAPMKAATHARRAKDHAPAASATAVARHGAKHPAPKTHR